MRRLLLTLLMISLTACPATGDDDDTSNDDDASPDDDDSSPDDDDSSPDDDDSSPDDDDSSPDDDDTANDDDATGTDDDDTGTDDDDTANDDDATGTDDDDATSDDDDATGTDDDDATSDDDDATGCTDDPYEPNDDLIRGALVGDSATFGLSACGDDDYFLVQATAGDTLTVAVTHTYAEGDLDLNLHGPDDSLLVSSATAADTESVSWTVIDDGLHAIHVPLTTDLGVLDGNVYTLDVAGSAVDCQSDAFEPNDAYQQASNVTVGSFGPMMMCANEDDWYAFTMLAGDTVTIDVLFKHDEGNIDASIHDAGNTTMYVDGSSGDDDESLTFSAPADGVYKLLLGLSNDGGLAPGNAYSLDISGASSVCVDDVWEPNEDRLTAPDLGPTFESGLSACPSDSDWFHVFAGAGEVMEISVFFDHGEGDIDLYLTDGVGTVMASSVTADDVETFTFAVPWTGPWFVNPVLSADAGVTPGNIYDLDIDISLPGCVLDAHEPNDSQGGAATLPSGTYTDLAGCMDDDDWYAVSATAGEEIGVQILFENAEGDLGLELLDPSGALLAESDTLEDEEALNGIAATSGDHFVHISLGTDSGAVVGVPYEMVLDIAAPTCGTDNLEPNDSFSNASQSGPFVINGLTSCATDDDWYTLPLGAGDFLEFGVFYTAAEGNIDVEIYDTDGTTLLGTGNTSSDDDVAAATVSTGGTYYTRVFLASDSGLIPGNFYNLEAGITTACTEDAMEPNNTLMEALPLPEGPHPGLHACSADSDWYGVTVGAGDTVDLEAVFAHAEGDINLALYDLSGALLTSSNSTTDNELASWTATTTGPVLVEVELVSDTGSVTGTPYSLEVTGSSTLCTPDNYEPNDTLGDWATFALGTPIFGSACPTDTDFYGFLADAGQTIEIEVTFTHADGDIDLILYDTLGQSFMTSASTTDGEGLTATASDSGIWYAELVLTSDSGDPGNPYEFMVTLN